MALPIVFWLLAGAFVVLHASATLRRRWLWPFCDWPMFATAPGLGAVDVFRIRIAFADGSTAWWKPHFEYRARDFSQSCSAMMARLDGEALAHEHLAEPLRRQMLAWVRADAPGVRLSDVRRLFLVHRRARVAQDGRSFAIEDDVILEVLPPRRPPPEVRA